jgi:hypothetical protein
MTSMMSRIGALLLRRRWSQFAPGQDNPTVSYVYAMMMMT